MGSQCCKTSKGKAKSQNQRNKRASYLHRGNTTAVLERLEYNKISKANRSIKNILYQTAYVTHNDGARSSSAIESYPNLPTLPQEISQTFVNENSFDSLSDEEEESEDELCKLPSSFHINEITVKPYEFELRNLLVNDKIKSSEVKGDLSLCKAVSRRLSINIQNLKLNSRQLELLRKEYIAENSNYIPNISGDITPRWSE
jgi:hypothetical protein